MMRLHSVVPGLLAVFALFAAGCGSPEAPVSPYCNTASCNSPYGVIGNLARAIALKDSAEVDHLLASDFSAQLGLLHALHIPAAPDSLSRSQFLAGFGVLFRRAKVSAAFDTVKAVNGPAEKPSWTGYDVQTNVTVGLGNGEVVPVQFPSNLYFRQEGGMWKLVEWQDRASTSRPEVRAADPNQVPWARRTPQAGN